MYVFGKNHNLQINHYGKCDIDYVVSREGDNQRLIRKSLDPRMCIGHPCRNWSNVPNVQCTDEDQVCNRLFNIPIIYSCYIINVDTFRILF